MDSLTFEEGTDKLPQNARKNIAFNAALHYSRAQIPLAPRRNLNLIIGLVSTIIQKLYTEFWEKTALKKGKKINGDKIVMKLWKLDEMEDACRPELQSMAECGTNSAANCSYTIIDFLCKKCVS